MNLARNTVPTAGYWHCPRNAGLPHWLRTKRVCTQTAPTGSDAKLPKAHPRVLACDLNKPGFDFIMGLFDDENHLTIPTHTRMTKYNERPIPLTIIIKQEFLKVWVFKILLFEPHLPNSLPNTIMKCIGLLSSIVSSKSDPTHRWPRPDFLISGYMPILGGGCADKKKHKTDPATCGCLAIVFQTYRSIPMELGSRKNVGEKANKREEKHSSYMYIICVLNMWCTYVRSSTHVICTKCA